MSKTSSELVHYRTPTSGCVMQVAITILKDKINNTYRGPYCVPAKCSKCFSSITVCFSSQACLVEALIVPRYRLGNWGRNRRIREIAQIHTASKGRVQNARWQNSHSDGTGSHRGCCICPLSLSFPSLPLWTFQGQGLFLSKPYSLIPWI